MKSIKNYILILLVAIATSTGSIYAADKEGISHEEYLRDVKQHISKSDLSKIDKTKFINMKAVFKGMDSGYIEPRIEVLSQKKAEVDALVSYIECFEINDEHLSKKHTELINKLRNMSYYLGYAQDKHEVALEKNNYISKYIKLVMEDKNDDGTCNYNIEKYNKNIKDIKDIIADMKKINESEYKELNKK